MKKSTLLVLAIQMVLWSTACAAVSDNRERWTIVLPISKTLFLENGTQIMLKTYMFRYNLAYCHEVISVFEKTIKIFSQKNLLRCRGRPEKLLIEIMLKYEGSIVAIKISCGQRWEAIIFREIKPEHIATMAALIVSDYFEQKEIAHAATHK